MLRIRFQRFGKKHQFTFRVVVVDQKQSIRGQYLEALGSYNVRDKKSILNTERIKYWISNGAQPSPTVHNLFVKSGIISGPKKSIKIKTPEVQATENKETATVLIEQPVQVSEVVSENPETLSVAPVAEEKPAPELSL